MMQYAEVRVMQCPSYSKCPNVMPTPVTTVAYHALSQSEFVSVREQVIIYDCERILSIASFRNCLRGVRSALGNRAWIASRAVFFVTVIRSCVLR